MIENIKANIKTAIPDATVHVRDPYQDGQHFEAYVISSSFEGLSLVKQHQMVLKALKNELDANVVHALALKTFTPERWAAEGAQFGSNVDFE